MSRRVHLPVLVDRRSLLRGAAAALIASLGGCRIVLDDPQEPGSSDPTGPDAEAGDPVIGAFEDAPAGTDAERCGDALCIDLAHPLNASLRTVGGARALTLEGKKLILVRVSDAEVIALSAICTHTGCTVKYSPTREDIECPCHGSTFALDGHVTHGPAASPLAQFPSTLDAVTGIVSIAI